MHIYIASDHAGFELKQELISFLEERRYIVTDLGAHTFDPQDDYPDFILPLAHKVAGERDARGIVLGGSGEGEAMAANRVKGVRATVYYGGLSDLLILSRDHNDANVLALGARFVTIGEAKTAVELWLATPFSGEERHKRRLAKF